jgi:predicted lipid carrier protein YhbT
MSHTPRRAPPLSPVLLAGFLARPVPLAPLRSLVWAAFAVMRRRHPEAFRRLRELDEADLLIDPIDLPHCFLLRVGREPPELTVFRAPSDAPGAAAAVHGPLSTLIGLLEGRLDGDAVFFSRDLVIEGDTAVVVAVRNALEGAEIDLVDDLVRFLGPLAAPARRVLEVAERVSGQASRDLEAVRAAMLAPVVSDRNRQSARLDEMEERLSSVERRAASTRARPTVAAAGRK